LQCCVELVVGFGFVDGFVVVGDGHVVGGV